MKETDRLRRFYKKIDKKIWTGFTGFTRLIRHKRMERGRVLKQVQHRLWEREKVTADFESGTSLIGRDYQEEGG